MIMDRKNIIKKLDNLVQEIGRIPKDSEIFKKKIVCDMRPLKKYFKEMGYDDWADYYRNKGYKRGDDIKVGDKYKSPNNITLDDLRIIFSGFYIANNRYPNST